MMVMIDQVAEHQGRALEPGNPAQGVQVRLEDEIAVAEVPVGRLVARNRLVLHVDGQQVVAAMGLLDDVGEKEVPGHPLAHEPALHVDHGHHHGIDLAGRHQAF